MLKYCERILLKRMAKNLLISVGLRLGFAQRDVSTLNLGGKAWHYALQLEASLTEVLKICCARFLQFLSFPSKQHGVFDKGRMRRGCLSPGLCMHLCKCMEAREGKGII